MGQKANIAGATLATLVFMGGAMALSLKTDWGEEVARRVVQDNVGAAVNGRFVIDEVRDIELFSPFGVARATAKGIKVFDEGGDEQFEVGELTAEIRLRALLSKRIHITRSSISGLMLPVDADTGRPKFGKPSPRRDVFKPREIELQLDNVDLVGLYLVARDDEDKKVMIGRMSGEMDILVPADLPGVQMKLRRIKGEVSQPRAVKLLEASGEVDTGATIVANLQFSAITSGAAITGHLRYVPSDKQDPLKFGVQRVRDAGIMQGNPMNLLQGQGLPIDAMKQFMPQR